MVQRQFTISQLEALVQANSFAPAGQGAFVEQVRPQVRHVPYQPPSLKRDIRRAIYNAVYHADGAVSRRQIADAIGVKKTTWLEAHIESLVQDCHLIKTAKPYRPGMPMYFYEVAR